MAAEEVRQRLAADPESPYHGLDLSEEIEPQDEEEEGDPTEREDTRGAARDAAFKESDHDRDNLARPKEKPPGLTDVGTPGAGASSADKAADAQSLHPDSEELNLTILGSWPAE